MFLYSILFFGTFWSVLPTKCHVVVPYRKRLNPWLINQHWARWWGLGGTKRQAGELLSGPRRDAKAKLMSFNRTQSRTVMGLLNGHNTLRRHLHMLGLTDSALCRTCGVEDETSGNIIFKCEAFASFGNVHLASFFLEIEDIQSISLAAICNPIKAMGLPLIGPGSHRAY